MRRPRTRAQPSSVVRRRLPAGPRQRSYERAGATDRARRTAHQPGHDTLSRWKRDERESMRTDVPREGSVQLRGAVRFTVVSIHRSRTRSLRAAGARYARCYRLPPFRGTMGTVTSGWVQHWWVHLVGVSRGGSNDSRCPPPCPLGHFCVGPPISLSRRLSARIRPSSTCIQL